MYITLKKQMNYNKRSNTKESNKWKDQKNKLEINFAIFSRYFSLETLGFYVEIIKSVGTNPKLLEE